MQLPPAESTALPSVTFPMRETRLCYSYITLGKGLDTFTVFVETNTDEAEVKRKKKKVTLTMRALVSLRGLKTLGADEEKQQQPPTTTTTKKSKATGLFPLRSLSLSLRSLFMYAEPLLFSPFLHWLFQVNRLQMVAAAVAAIFNTWWPQPLTLRSAISDSALTSSAQQDTLLRPTEHKTTQRHETS